MGFSGDFVRDFLPDEHCESRDTIENDSQSAGFAYVAGEADAEAANSEKDEPDK